MPETTLLEIQDSLLGEIETEIVGRQYHAAKILPGDQVNVERDSKNRHDQRAIRVETGCREPVGYRQVQPVRSAGDYRSLPVKMD